METIDTGCCSLSIHQAIRDKGRNVHVTVSAKQDNQFCQRCYSLQGAFSDDGGGQTETCRSMDRLWESVIIKCEVDIVGNVERGR